MKKILLLLLSLIFAYVGHELGQFQREIACYAVDTAALELAKAAILVSQIAALYGSLYLQCRDRKQKKADDYQQ